MSIIHSVTVSEILDLNTWHHVKNKFTAYVLTLVNCWLWPIEKTNTTIWWQNLTSPALWSLYPVVNFHPASCKKGSFWLRQKVGNAAKLFLQLRPAKWVFLKVKEKFSNSWLWRIWQHQISLKRPASMSKILQLTQKRELFWNLSILGDPAILWIQYIEGL